LAAEIRARAARADAGPRKRWGQNFLIDAAVLAQIAEVAAPDPDGSVLEIGPGPGTLTERLAARCRRVVAIERDPRWASFLPTLWPDGAVEIVGGDATRVDWRGLLTPPGPWRLAGNIPYNLSGPLLIRAWELRSAFRTATFMLQAEVADRLTARPGTKSYGGLTVLFAAAGSVVRVRRVPSGAFWPPPKVDSAVVQATFDRPLGPAEGRRLQRVVRAAFGQRRKTLRNALGAALGRDWVASLETEFDLNRRAETLSPEEMQSLAAKWRGEGDCAPGQRAR
jgi:16S rRNA (adenine1518-N6/adenine1519-N6)-dimethyltransferase